MAWRVAKSILTLHKQLRPLAPKAPASSFGTIGDVLHDSTSDHAPHNFPGWGSQIVTAGDFPHAERLNSHAVLEAIRRSRDPRVKYGISRGQMYSSYAAHGYAPFTWRPYGGKDGHFDHAHISVVGDARADGVHPWQISLTESAPAPTAKGDDMTPEQANTLERIALTLGWLIQGKERTGPQPGLPSDMLFDIVPNRVLRQLTEKPAGTVTLTAEDRTAIVAELRLVVREEIAARFADAGHIDDPASAG